ncbi:MAG TPA: energy transducer TonB [Terriglobales bacterium]
METLEKVVPATAFESLPAFQINWSLLGVVYVAQVLMLVLVAETGISFMAPVLNPIDTRESVHLVAPVLPPPAPVAEPVAKVKELPEPRPVITPKLQVQLPKPPSLPVEVPQPKVEVAKVTPRSLPAPIVKTDTFHSPELAAGPKVPRVAVSTNFGGSSAPVTVSKPAREVQTGGFGDPNGVPVNPNSTGKGPSIPKVGSFDLPAGQGTGNGTGGAKGTPGTVASAGFGNGIAVQGEGGSSTGRQEKVRSTGFGSVEPAPSDGPKRQVTTTASKDAPVSLLSKPTPSYTLEARQRKIEGDVELEVEFTATGQVHVLRVVKGLGYGLDESAVKAAEKIRFAPARRDGQAIDAQGRLRVVFRLS